MRRAGLERAGLILTTLFGVGFLLLGLRYFADPGALTAETDVVMPSTKAVMEIRTVYGGMFVGVGLATALLGWRETTVRAALRVLALVAGSVALARLAAIVLGQTPDPLFAALLAIEIVGVALAAWILRGLAAGTDP